jgi:hypothetical protein
MPRRRQTARVVLKTGVAKTGNLRGGGWILLTRLRSEMSPAQGRRAAFQCEFFNDLRAGRAKNFT